MSLSFANSIAVLGRPRALVPLCVGAGAYLFFLFLGDTLLRDSDSFWQIRIGQWILDHGALPTTDFYSFTRTGAPWISTSWLSQVALAYSHAHWGWAGPVILTATAVALAVAILVHLLEAHIEAPRAVLFVMLALALPLSIHHVLARPHILALPVMVAWVGLLMDAADRRTAPSWTWLPLIALWANLHGGFVLGLALIGPISLEAVEHAEKGRRLALFMRWVLFGIFALIASCCTPYGWRTLQGATNILSLGELLTLILEWMPANFATFTPFEGALLALIAFGYYRGLVLSAPRIFLILFLTWSALTHVRSIDAFAFLLPLVLAKPLGEMFPRPAPDAAGAERWPARYMTALGALTIVAASWTSTSLYMGHHRFTFTMTQTPVAAVDLLEQRQAKRIFNAYQFGGYLISRDIPVFIDGRAELYGEKFVMDFFKATEGKKPELLPRLLDAHAIDATLLVADAPGPQILDQLKGWKRIYADDVAVVHVRDPATTAPSK